MSHNLYQMHSWSSTCVGCWHVAGWLQLHHPPEAHTQQPHHPIWMRSLALRRGCSGCRDPLVLVQSARRGGSRRCVLHPPPWEGALSQEMMQVGLRGGKQRAPQVAFQTWSSGPCLGPCRLVRGSQQPRKRPSLHQLQTRRVLRVAAQRQGQLSHNHGPCRSCGHMAAFGGKRVGAGWGPLRHHRPWSRAQSHALGVGRRRLWCSRTGASCASRAACMMVGVPGMQPWDTVAVG